MKKSEIVPAVLNDAVAKDRNIFIYTNIHYTHLYQGIVNSLSSSIGILMQVLHTYEYIFTFEHTYLQPRWKIMRYIPFSTEPNLPPICLKRLHCKHVYILLPNNIVNLLKIVRTLVSQHVICRFYSRIKQRSHTVFNFVIYLLNVSHFNISVILISQNKMVNYILKFLKYWSSSQVHNISYFYY